MYASKYVSTKEVTGLYHIIENFRYQGLPAPELREIAEEATPFERLLSEAVTPEEHLLMVLLDKLLDDAWKFGTGKALRGELRKMFKGCGYSDRRFYAAFHSVEKRVLEC